MGDDLHPNPEEAWQLTAQGRTDARDFGRRIPAFAHLFLTHSRIARTRDTALEIASGFREAHPNSIVEIEGVDPALSLTTYYARNQTLREQWKEKLGLQFYDEWLRGQIPKEVLAPVREAVSDLVERLHSRIELSPVSSLALAVSHDVYIFAVRQALFGRRAAEWPSIGYLDGVILTWDPEGHLVARCHDETARGGPR